MTIIQNEQLKHGQQEKWFKNFHENFDLNVTSQEPEQKQPDLQWELLENRYSQYSELSVTMENHRDNISLEAQLQENQVPQTKTSEGCVDDLLILAQSAEIVAQSEDSVVGMHTNNQENKVIRTRLTQIRKQARHNYIILDQERAEDSRCKHSQENTIRLNQIKCQARCKSKHDLSPQMISGSTNEQPKGRILRLNQMKHQARSHDLSPQMITGSKNELPKGRILRLSQMKHRARSKGNSTVKDGTEMHVDQSLPRNSFKDSNPSVECVPAHNFYRGDSQSSAVRWDIENRKERQRAARRLRAFKTKKLRQQQLRTKSKINYASVGLHDAMRTSLIGLTANSEAQKKFVPVKRLRLTQLRHEARLGNHYSAMQGLPGN